MRSRAGRILITLLLAVSLSCSMALAWTGEPSPDGQPGSSETVAGSEESKGRDDALPSGQTDPDVEQDGQKETPQTLQEEQDQEQEPASIQEEEIVPEDTVMQAHEAPQDAQDEPPAQIDDPPAQTEEPVVYEIFSRDGCLYYGDPKTGEICTTAGFIKYNGSRCYVLDGGKIAVSMTVTVGGKKYHAGTDGVIITGVHRWNGDYCYSDANGVLKTSAGFIRVDGSRYYVRKGGSIAVNRTVTVKGNKYHAGKNGVIRTGVHKWKKKYYYSIIKTGKVRKKAGFVKYSGSLYYIRKGGVIAAGKVFYVGSKAYRANSNGKIATGVYKKGGKYYYSDPKTGEWIRTERFKKWNKKQYYIQADGTLAAGKVFAAKNRAYYADKKARVRKLAADNPTNSKVLAVAQSQVGIMTGKKYWEWFFSSSFKDTDRTPWCGTFVGWCYNEAGEYSRISPAGNIAYVPCYTWFANRRDKWISKASARGGDIAVFGRDRHVGIVEKVYKGYLITIEGNSGPTAAWGCGLPGAVTRKVYPLGDSDIKGIIRP